MLVGTSLQTRGRFEGPEGLRGRVDATPAGRLPSDLNSYETVVLDLDEVGLDPVERLKEAGFAGRIIGFYSHIDDALGSRAAAAGVEAYRRGRFWRDLVQIMIEGHGSGDQPGSG